MQFLDAISPSNFIYTNPVVLYETISTNGENVVQGLSNLLKDIKNSKELFNISRTHKDKFKIGKNIACTKGEVVYKNDLMELICYTPTQKSNYEIPLLIVPPWINKYYILDLSPKNSLVKYLVDKGITVFVISWVNPTAKHRDTLFDHYLSEGALEAIDVIQNKFKINKMNVLGYCIGGALTTILLAYLAYHKKDSVINTATMLATLLDYREGGDLSLFIDEKQLEHFKDSVLPEGYYDSNVMSMGFSILRANDMIWSFAINNYLLGKKPLPFDILYWNADSTRLPSKMHNYYLKNMYLENNLIKSNKIIMYDTPIDLGIIKTPCYFISTYEDHIVPWKGTYNALQYLKCPVEFILAGSGHVAGIVNPPQKHKYCYWTNKDVSQSANTWFHNAKEHDGSWWKEWIDYLHKNSGKKKSVTHIKDTAKKLSIGKAPGDYINHH